MPMATSRKVAIAVVVAYALAIGPLGYMSYLFMNNTVLEMNPNPDSLVGQSMSKTVDLFHHGQVYVRPFVMMITNNAPTPIIENPLFKNFSDAVYNGVYGTPETGGGYLANNIESFDGYYTIPDYIATMRSRTLGGTNNDTTILQLEIRGDVDMAHAVDSMVDWVNGWTGAYNPTFTVKTTSVSQVFEDLASGIVGDLLKVDAVSIPISVLVLVMCVGSARMLNIPGVLVPVTLAASFGVMYLISLGLSISSLAPEMCAAVLLAVTVDYSLFFSTRFLDEAERMRREVGEGVELTDEQKYHVVYRTTTLTAHNVLVSGMTIAISLAGISLLPAGFIRAIGLVFAVAACVAMFVAMTLTPAILLVFYNYFSAPRNITWENAVRAWRIVRTKICCCCINPNNQHDKASERDYVAIPASATENAGGLNASGTSTKNPSMMDLNYANNSNSQKDALLLASRTEQGHDINRNSYNATGSLTGETEGYDVNNTNAKAKEAFLAQALIDQRNSPWYKAGTFAVRYPYVTILLVFALGAPFFYYASTIRTDFIIAHQVPRDAPHVKTLNELSTQIGGGAAFPFFTILVGHKDGDVMEDRFFNLTYEFMLEIQKNCDQPINTALTYAYIDGLGPISADMAKFFLNNSWFPGAQPYQFLFGKTVNAERSAGVVQFVPTFDPFGAEAYDYLNKMADTITAFQEAHSDVFSFIGVIGSSSGSWQIMKTVLVKFPLQIGVTFAVIFVLIAGTFRSIFIPIRMLVTVAYTVAFAYGAGCIVFQHEWIWKVWPGMEGVTSYSWTAPIFSFSLLCALALDYDIFLLTRVVEMKQLGFTDEAAIIKAVHKTGRIISFAGVIMAVAFGALMFASVVLLNQYAFTAFVAVLVDTFIVRTFLVPALMCVVPSIVWWPRKFPDANREIDDMDH